MPTTQQTVLASRPAAMVLALSLVAGLSAPFLMLPRLHAAAAPIVPSGLTELSPVPVNQITAVPPNIALTFDDSGSMQSSRVNDNPPWTTDNSGHQLTYAPDWGNGANQTSTTSPGGGPWRCANVIDPTATSGILAHVMNGVYYNPNIVYTPPLYASGTTFPNADNTLAAVWVDGIAVNRPLNPATSDLTAGYYGNADLDRPSAGALTNLMGTATFQATTTYYASFGACPANADAGSCNNNNAKMYTSGGNKNKYYFSYKPSSANTTGSGTSEIVSSTSLTTGTSTNGGWTQVVGSTASTVYHTWTITTTSGQATSSDNRWQCGTGSATSGGGGDLWNAASPMDGQSHTLSDGTTITYPNGGPYYYRLKQGVTIALDPTSGNPTYTGSACPGGTPDCDGLRTLYDPNNWEAVPVTNTNVTINGVTVNQYQNFANWYAYYRTRNQMARTALSRVFGSPALAQKTATGGYGGDIRVAWQNLNSGTYKLPSTTIISALIDTSACLSSASASPSAIQQSGATTTPPDCYRSAFFNWIFQVPANGGTPTRSALARAGDFFKRGAAAPANGTLEDPYWQPPPNGTYSSSNAGNEVYCRQNFHMLITDGLWNGDSGLPSVQSLPAALPDGVSFPAPGGGNVTSIYAPQHDASGAVSLSDLAMVYWANNLRPDLYQGGAGAPKPSNIVPPYLPDTSTSLFGSAGNVSGGYGKAKNIPAEEYFNPNNDPATWPHMSEYLIGLGVNGQLNFSTNTDCTDTSTASAQDACDLRKGATNSAGIIGWPTPSSAANGGAGIPANVDDTWHAALAGRGQFFSAGNPQQLVDQLTSILSNITARASAPTPGAVNASVATVGTLSFNVGYNADWSGIFQAVVLNSDGTVDKTAKWDAGTTLNARAASSRNIYTDAYNAPASTGSPCVPSTSGFSGGLTFNSSSTLDCVESTGLQLPALGSSPDSVANRINYLRGDQTNEVHGTSGIYRTRANLLGAIIHSQPVYVSYPSGNYYDSWPSGSPEIAGCPGSCVQTYDAFVAANATRAGTVYVGANDGMLHAFAAPAPTCTGIPPTCAYSGGNELWAFVPRAVYSNLGNLTSANNFNFRPTVDATPVTRDVFFSEGGINQWRTILAGGVGVGGRGVYALNITDPTAFSASSVLWEFDSDMATPDCVSIVGTGQSGTCSASDLGYTVSQPNIGRLALKNPSTGTNGTWVVLVPNGYFPDCSKPDYPTADYASCAAIAAQAPKDGSGNPYSALYVLDAQKGTVIAELKTPTIPGVTSFGLATPVMGDYNNDQVDDVAFAGDLQGNLWRFDLSSTSATGWTVTLVYKGLADASGNQGLQPITTMPRLFPDPATNRFMVVFGTGKYLGAGDNSSNTVQAMMGVRDVLGTTFSQTDPTNNLTQDYLQETIAPSTLPDGSPNPNAGATLRCVTGGASDTCDAPTPVTSIPAVGSTGGGGWLINLCTSTGGPCGSTGATQTNSGERVVVDPGAIFASNTVVFETLLAGAAGSDPCNPATQGAIMALNAVTGAPAGVSSLGGPPIVGGRISNARTSGSLPIVSALGGGQAYLPGTTLAPSGTKPLSIDAPIWRRRSWNEINQNQ